MLKPTLFAVITVLGVALTIVPAHAHGDSAVLANVPFELSVGNTAPRAGSYMVEQLESGIIALSSADGRE